MNKFENVYQDAALMKKVLLGEADETEQGKLEKRLAECPDLQKAYEQLQNGETLKVAFKEYRNYSSKKAYQSFLQRIGEMDLPKNGEPEMKEEKQYPLRIWWYAAAAVVILTIGLSFYLSNNVATEEEKKVLIQPGTRQAQLTLPDGSVIDVDKKEVSVVVDGVQVQYKKGVLAYLPTETLEQEKEDEEEAPCKSNTLRIPRGAENTVILTDGTIVHLNAGSKLTYPVRFGQKKRTVLLEGEGYFRVKEDKERPFVVKTHFGDVTVYGTEFNVSAYNDGKTCCTTLVSGKVSCANSSQGAIVLSPGEQAVSSVDRLEKRAVDIEEYVGWVKGEYVFNDRSLGEIMQTFERWYDINVYYETPALRNLTYSGNLKRYGTINTFLDALEITGDIYYKINGKNILIYENE